jgi:hypothetical protein
MEQPELLAYQQRALRQLREHASQKSRFYHDYHEGLSSAPLSALPLLTKQPHTSDQCSETLREPFRPNPVSAMRFHQQVKPSQKSWMLSHRPGQASDWLVSATQQAFKGHPSLNY